MPILTLESLVAENKIQENTANVRSLIAEMEVPQGQFIWLSLQRPHRLRLAAYEIQSHSLTADDINNGYITSDALSDQPAKPPSRYIPEWPDYDGYTFKVFLRYVDAGGNAGAWVQAQIQAVDWDNRTLQIALPTTLPDANGADHTLAEGDTVDVRISYAMSSGILQLVRETPDNARQKAAKEAWITRAHILNVRDQLHTSGRIRFDKKIWAPQHCLIRFYLTAPVTLDIDPEKSVTLFEIFYNIMDMAAAEAEYQRARIYRPELPTNLYALYVAQLVGVAKEEPPFALPEG
jgi:hypothetical protein